MGRDEHQADLDALQRRARASRRRPSRALWVVALAFGLAGVIGFIAILLEPDAGSSTASTATGSHGFGLAGLVVAAGAGVAIGLAIARQRRGDRESDRESDRDSDFHSERNSP